MEIILLLPAFYPEVTIIVVIALIGAGALLPLRAGGRILLFTLAAGLIFLMIAGQVVIDAIFEILNLVGL